MTTINADFVDAGETALNSIANRNFNKSNDAANSQSPVKLTNGKSEKIVCSFNNTYGFKTNTTNNTTEEFKNCVVVIEDNADLEYLGVVWSDDVNSSDGSMFIDLRIKNCPSLKYISLPPCVNGVKYVETVSLNDQITSDVLRNTQLGHIVMIVSDATTDEIGKHKLLPKQNPLNEALGINGCMSEILVVFGGTKEIEVMQDPANSNSVDRVEKFIKEPFVVYHEVQAGDDLLDSAVITRSLSSVDFKDIIVDVLVVDELALARENPLKRKGSLSSAPSIINGSELDLSQFVVVFLSKNDDTINTVKVGPRTKSICLDGFSKISQIGDGGTISQSGRSVRRHRSNPSNMLDCVSLSRLDLGKTVLNLNAASQFFGISNSKVNEVKCNADATKIFVQDTPIKKFTALNSSQSHMYGVRSDDLPMIEHLVLDGSVKQHSGFMEDEFVACPKVSGQVVTADAPLYLDPAISYTISEDEIKALNTTNDAIRINAILRACSDATEPENVLASLLALGMLFKHGKADIEDIWASRSKLLHCSLKTSDLSDSPIMQGWFLNLPQVDPFSQDSQDEIQRLKIEAAWISDLMICVEASKAKVNGASEWCNSNLTKAFAPIQMYTMIALTTTLYSQLYKGNTSYASLGKVMLDYIIASSKNFANLYSTVALDSENGWKCMWQSEQPFECLGVVNVKFDGDNKSFNQLFENIQGSVNTSNFAFKQHAYYIETIFSLLALDQLASLYNLSFDLQKVFVGNAALLDKDERKKCANAIILNVLEYIPYDQNMVKVVLSLQDVNTNMQNLASSLKSVILDRQGINFDAKAIVTGSITPQEGFSGRLQALGRGSRMSAISRNPFLGDDDDDDDDDDEALYTHRNVKFTPIRRK